MTLADAVEAHEAALARTGGRPGMLSRDNLESALGRPYSGYHRSIERKAAALLEAVVRNHGFVDGNKRTAAVLATILLDRSGYRIPDLQEDSVSAEFEELILGIADRSRTFDDAYAWFKLHCERRTTRRG